MFAVSIGIYSIIMVFIWGFFLVAKVHFFKFRNYSIYLIPATKFLLISLMILTIIGAYLVFKISYVSTNSNTETIQESATNDVY